MTNTGFVFDVLIPVGKIVAVILYPMLMTIVMIWLERRVVAWMQKRLGPNRVGFQGILQPFADAFKLFFKEDIMQDQADPLLFRVAPVMVMFSSLLAFCFVPLGEPIRIGTYQLTLWIAQSPVGLLLAPNGNLIATNGDAVNPDATQPSELVEFTPEGKFVAERPVNFTAQGGAFGIAIRTVGNKIYFAAVDDVLNNLDVWFVR